jgi:hypothetical protein
LNIAFFLKQRCNGILVTRTLLAGWNKFADETTQNPDKQLLIYVIELIAVSNLLIGYLLIGQLPK